MTRILRYPAVRLAGLLFLFVLSVSVCLYFGRRGFNPLDQSVVFDGGWRILSGQIPFRDFSALTGTAPSIIQAFFFAVLGVDWFAYCLHAALFNGVFCLLVFRFLRLFHLPFWTACFYAAASAVGFYPPMGTPYMEQHGFFFLLAAMLSLHSCVRSPSEWHRTMWATMGSLFFLACFFSKQNAALFGLLPLGVFLLFLLRGKNRLSALRALLAGAVVAGAIVLFAVLGFGISLKSLFVELFEIPVIVSAGRGSPLKWILFGPFIQGLNLITVGLSSIAFAASLFAYRRGPTLLMARSGRTVWLAMLAAAFEVACMTFARGTDNQKENCFPFVFLSLGLLHAAVRSAPGVRRHSAALAAVLVLLAMRDTVQFAYYVNMRSVQDIKFNGNRAVPFQTPGLRFLRYHPWAIYGKITPPHLDHVIAILRDSPDNFLLIGDFAILYGLTGKPSPLPSLWFHQALGFPSFQSSFLPAYEKQLLEHLHTYRVKTIVLERDATWAEVSLRTFPALSALVHERVQSSQSVGPFTILHLSEPF